MNWFGIALNAFVAYDNWQTMPHMAGYCLCAGLWCLCNILRGDE